MTMPSATRRSDYGMSCARCGDALIAPEWSECVSAGQVRHSWFCVACGCRFETAVDLDEPAEAQLDQATVEEFLPSLLVA